MKKVEVTGYQTSTQNTSILELSNSSVFKENLMLILGDGCGFFLVLKNCYLKKVFKGKLVIVPRGTHRSTGKIYHNYLL